MYSNSKSNYQIKYVQETKLYLFAVEYYYLTQLIKLKEKCS